MPDDPNSGRAIVTAAYQLPADARERAIADAILAGNTTLAWHPVTLSAGGRTVTLSVSADYLTVGRVDPVRVPLFPATAQRIADALGAMLPTPRMVDAIWRAATVKVAPRPMTPHPGAGRDSGALLLEHDALVDTDIAGRTGLTAGQKKDIVVGAVARRNPGKVAIYGWHQLSGTPIQPLSTVHSARYSDYSHGVRLVSRTALVDGVPTPIEAVFADASLAGLVSGDGVLSAASLRY
jgi:hypothetical protein